MKRDLPGKVAIVTGAEPRAGRAVAAALTAAGARAWPSTTSIPTALIAWRPGGGKQRRRPQGIMADVS